MAILQMRLALVCLGLSYRVTPVYHCSKPTAVSALICSVLPFSVTKRHWRLQSQVQGWPKADSRVDSYCHCRPQTKKLLLARVVDYPVSTYLSSIHCFYEPS